MDIIMLIAAITVSIGGIFALMRHLMMFQQSSYFLKRYYKWLSGAVGARSVIAVLLFISLELGLVFCRYHFLLTAIISLYRISLAVSDRKKAIKKLVMTPRMKRQTLTASLLFAVSIALGFFVDKVFYLITIALACAVPLLLTLSALINKPIEKAVSNYYINDAKKILKNHKGLKVIGITGSYGKTSTKFILSRILSERFNVVNTPESYNTPMGVVRTVRDKLTAPTEIFIAEMGAKKRGDIKEICDICHPDIGIVTSVGPQHLDTFKNIDNVLRTKSELSDEVIKNGGTVYLNIDNEYLRSTVTKYDAVTFGESKNADVRAENITYGASGLKFDIVKGDLKFSVHTALLGRHAAANITAAAAVALSLGETPDEIAFAVSTLKPVEHRLQMRPYINGSLLIDDAYNANPSGCLDAVNVLASFEGMKKIIVTPGLVELGEREFECNKTLGAAAGEKSDIIILVGQKRSIPLREGINETSFNKDNLFVVDKFSDAAAKLGELCDENTVVLIENDLPDNYAG